jgi:V/A-type H+-transporting ATPase subunit I
MIVPMKKAQIVVLKEDKDRLLKSLQKYGELMVISENETIEHDSGFENAFIQRTQKALKLTKGYRGKSKALGVEREVTYQEFIKIDPQRKALLEEIEETDKSILKLQNENEGIYSSIASLAPWSRLDFSTTQFSQLKYAKIHTGFVEGRNVDRIVEAINDFGGVFDIFDKSVEGQAIVFACYNEDNEALLEKARSIGFNEINLEKVDKLFKDLINEKEVMIQTNDALIEEYKQKLQRLSEDTKGLEILNDQTASENEIKKVSPKHTLETIYLEGWVRNDRTDRLKKAIHEATEFYDMALYDPKEDEIPPTVTKNNKFVTQFETITDMFSIPNQGDVDPNPVMSIWYWIIFGIMMGDAGYGVLMLILFFALLKIMKPKGEAKKLFTVLFLSGFTTIFWGVMFGSYFGVTWNPILFEPMTQPLDMLIFSLILGTAHILSGVVMKAYGNFKQGNYLDIILDQLSWIILVLGIGFIFVPSLKNIGIKMAAVGALIIIFGAGRSKKNIFAKLGGGFTGLYGVTGYMSDILSYSRLLALGLSTAVVSMVMNMMAGMIQGSIIGFVLSIFVYLLGHGFNLAMGLLSAYVHDSRLQYIEFFGKFYEGGGYGFKPLSLKLQYIDKVNDK